MIKRFNDFAKASFTRALADVLPDYKLKKSLRGPLAGAANHEWRLDKLRAGWICFGGFKDRDFCLLCGWTLHGIELRNLDEWEQYGNPRAFEVPPIPMDGYVDLRDRWRFEADKEGGAWHSLDLGSPPEKLARPIFATYRASAAFEQQVERLYQGSLRISTKAPPSLETVRHNTETSEWAYCRSSWQHLADRHTFTDSELHSLMDPIVEKAMGLVLQYGALLLEKRLAQDAEAGKQAVGPSPHGS